MLFIYFLFDYELMNISPIQQWTKGSRAQWNPTTIQRSPQGLPTYVWTGRHKDIYPIILQLFTVEYDPSPITLPKIKSLGVLLVELFLTSLSGSPETAMSLVVGDGGVCMEGELTPFSTDCSHEKMKPERTFF